MEPVQGMRCGLFAVATFPQGPKPQGLPYAISSIAGKALFCIALGWRPCATVAPELAVLAFWASLLGAARAAAAAHFALPLRAPFASRPLSFRHLCWVTCYLILASITEEDIVVLPGPRYLVVTGRRRRRRCRWWAELIFLPLRT